MTSNKKELSPERREELLGALKARFEKTCTAIKVLNGLKLRRNWMLVLKMWSLNEMERTGGEPDIVGYDKRRLNIFLMIVQRKVLKVAEVFVTTLKDWSQGKSINQKITLLIWQLPWALNF